MRMTAINSNKLKTTIVPKTEKIRFNPYNIAGHRPTAFLIAGATVPAAHR